MGFTGRFLVFWVVARERAASESCVTETRQEFCPVHQGWVLRTAVTGVVCKIDYGLHRSTGQ